MNKSRKECSRRSVEREGVSDYKTKKQEHHNIATLSFAAIINNQRLRAKVKGKMLKSYKII